MYIFKITKKICLFFVVIYDVLAEKISLLNVCESSYSFIALNVMQDFSLTIFII